MGVLVIFRHTLDLDIIDHEPGLTFSFRHKGAFAGGAPYIWGNGWKATGGKKLPRGAMNQHEYLAADNHTYGRTMQMSLEAHSTEWIHPTLMPMSMRIAAQQKNE